MKLILIGVLGAILFKAQSLSLGERDTTLGRQALKCSSGEINDPAFCAAATGGWYTFSETYLGKLIGDKTANWLTLICAAFSCALYYRLASMAAGDEIAALLATFLFALGFRLLRIADVAVGPTLDLGRAISLPIALASLLLYLDGFQDWAWVVATYCVYLHPSPALYLLMVYTIDNPRYLPISASALLPMIITEIRETPLSQPILEKAYSVVHPRVLIDLTISNYDWGLSFIGWGLIGLAGFRMPDSRAKDLTGKSMLIFWLAALARWVWWPLHLPFATVAVKLTARWAFMFLFSWVGLGWCCRVTVDVVGRNRAAIGTLIIATIAFWLQSRIQAPRQPSSCDYVYIALANTGKPALQFAQECAEHLGGI